MNVILLLIIPTLIPLCHADGKLSAGGGLGAGSTIQNCGYNLTMQSDCNLVLKDDVVIWSTGTAGRGSTCIVTMQTDGNLVIYSYPGRVLIWSSNTYRRVSGSYYLFLQCDRNLVIYTPQVTPIWNTGTTRRLNGVMANGTILTNTTSTKKISGDLQVKSSEGKT